MTTGAFSFRKHVARLNPAEAEIRFLVHVPDAGADLKVTGRLMGPRCPYSSTVEVAYPLRALSREAGGADPEKILFRCVIPDPCMWDTQSPFLYLGVLDLWRGDERLDRQQVQIGFVSWGLGTRGLRVNGKPVQLQAARVGRFGPAEAPSFREQGINCVVVDAGRADAEVWDTADRHGFFVLGRVEDVQALRKARAQEGRPSCLGWIVNREVLPALTTGGIEGTAHTGSAPLVGLDVSEASEGMLPGVSFLVAPPGFVGENNPDSLPWLQIQREPGTGPALDVSTSILGTLRHTLNPDPGAL